MKSLFDKDGRFTPEALELDSDASTFLRSKMKEYLERGYSPRDIGHVLHLSAIETELEAVLLLDQKT